MSTSDVLHRQLDRRLPTVVSGSGPYLVDDEGRRYLDASGGAAVSCLGHDHPRVVEAIARQASRVAFAHTSMLTNAPMEELAHRLIDAAPPGIARVAFLSGGSEAVEAALKLARQYFMEIGQPERRYVIARHQSYHGNTLGALSVSGHAARRAFYAPFLAQNVAHIPPCYAYRHQAPDETPEAYGLRAADALEAKILELGAGTVAAFIAEPIVGATLGAVPAVPGYFRRVREICDRHGVLFIADEVMCGMGRSGTLFAMEQEGAVPDLITVAKGLAAGYQPLGALLVGQRIVEAIAAGSGALAHGHTYMGHAIACAAGVAVFDAIREEGLLHNVRRLGGLLEDGLRARFGQHPHVGDIRGRGLLWALELVESRDDKRPFPRAARLHAAFKETAMRHGLICYPSGGTADGLEGDHVLLAPPYNAEPAHIEEIVELVGKALSTVLSAQLGSDEPTTEASGA
ncbi:hypothetical protein SAMN06265365_102386 [Tistlia consotensis]|uniref:Adenosylmethionine-8-amino-7-oxononanoate aminotransferase n=1 Tax=Tistlia consotensis USBA 355 TaxID=560819 RepID=A0A1Y6C6K4_9PROT|nr:aspartate aminotransferase family protein [Tistlia consotensis]SMF38851.1 hypothetical protein SAMN05428998_11377 [Tistlia consotensis USBA 355]SNR36790.1 hypothetical protein SAMN06265365_102386 [Tistlia consotensis]